MGYNEKSWIENDNYKRYKDFILLSYIIIINS